MAENAEALSDFDLWSLLDLTGFAIYRLRQVELAKESRRLDNGPRN